MGDLFEPTGAGANWAPPSRMKVQHGWGRYLRFCRDANLDIAGPDPGARVSPPLVDAYIQELGATCAPYSVANRIQELYDAMRVLAPEHDWSWLRQLFERLHARAEPVTEKRCRLRPSGELKELGRALMAEAESAEDRGQKDRALLFRDGLIIGLLAYRPFRSKNFSAMRIGKHLVPNGTGYMIAFEAHEMKAGREQECVFPRALVSPLERYLGHYRPILLKPKCQRQPTETDALWVSRRGKPLSRRSLANPINKHTVRAFGKAIPPHWFRDCSGTTVAIENPIYVSDVQHVLGHANPRTAENHYNQARGIEASRRHQQHLAALRKTLGRKQAQPGRTT
jgi:integrase/recombinase XerD